MRLTFSEQDNTRQMTFNNIICQWLLLATPFLSFVANASFSLPPIDTWPEPETASVIALWNNGKCKGAPAIAIPIGNLVDLAGCAGPLDEEIGTTLPLRILKNGRPIINSVNYVGFQCKPKRAYAVGTDCSRKLATKKNFQEYCLTLDVPFPLPISARLLCGKWPFEEGCDPKYATNKQRCTKRSNTCLASSFVLKWTGRGCRNNGKIQGDGGCQCKGYCGYKCKGACNKDKEGTQSCWHKQTLLFNAFEGSKIPTCSIGGLLPFVNFSEIAYDFRPEAGSLVQSLMAMAGAVQKP